MIAKILQRIAANRPARAIDSDGQPYLRRVYLAHWGGWRLYLHKYAGADGDATVTRGKGRPHCPQCMGVAA